MKAIDRAYHYDMPAVADHWRSEIDIQVSIRNMLAADFPDCLFAAVPNGMRASYHAARRAKREGMSKGFPDAMILAPGKVAFVEVKARSQLKHEQHDWLDQLHAWGFPCGVFRSPNTLAAKLRAWGFPSRGAARPIGVIVAPIVADVIDRAGGGTA